MNQQLASQNFCQSCGMPLEAETELGTNSDGSPNPDYCSYCYQNGSYTADISMAEMIEVCVPFMVDGSDGMTPEAARSMMQQFFPSLKRWQSAPVH